MLFNHFCGRPGFRVFFETVPGGAAAFASDPFSGGLRFSHSLRCTRVQIVNFCLRLGESKLYLFLHYVHAVGVQRVNHGLYKFICGRAAGALCHCFYALPRPILENVRVNMRLF